MESLSSENAGSWSKAGCLLTDPAGKQTPWNIVFESPLPSKEPSNCSSTVRRKQIINRSVVAPKDTRRVWHKREAPPPFSLEAWAESGLLILRLEAVAKESKCGKGPLGRAAGNSLAVLEPT